MDPLGVSQIIESPKKQISTQHRPTASQDLPPEPPAKEVHTPASSSSAGPSRVQQQQLNSPNVAQWPASPISGGSGNFSAQQTATPPWNQPQSSPARPSPGQPRSPYTREPPPPARVEISDDDTAPISSGARYNAQQAQEQAQARARQGMQQSREAAANLEALREKDRVEGYVRIRVLGMERNKKDLWVKMEATTNLSTYHQAHIKPFSRSFGECIALHLALASNHPQLIIPALPLTETAAANAEEEERLLRTAFQKWFDRISRDFNLARDDEVRSFLEAHFGYTPVTIRRRLKPSSSFGSLGLRSSKSSYDPEDDMSHIKGDMAQLETTFADVARAIDKVGRNRKLLAGALYDASEQLAAFSTVEQHKPLQLGFRKVAEGTRRLGDIDSGLATAESVTLADALAYSSAEAKEAKDALLQRQLIVEEHRNASKNAINKKRQIEKLKSSNNIKPERADEALDEFEDAKKVETVLAAKVQAVSERLAPSLQAHTKQMHDDFFEALMLHARTGAAFEKQALKDLEQLRPAIKNIPAKSAGEIVYVHQASPSVAPERPSSSHSRSGSVPSQPSSPAVLPGSQSMFVPPTHNRAASATQSRINDLAKSVVLPGGATDSIKGRERVVDERRRVDARSAAAKLANGF